MSVQESPAPAQRSRSLKREVGLIGLMWASVGSIIGSGWLFGAQKGLIAAANSAATWWKIAVPLLVILVLAFGNFHGSNFSAADGFSPDGFHGILAAISTSGIIFSYLGFEQADQLAGEAKNPKRDIPIAI